MAACVAMGEENLPGLISSLENLPKDQDRIGKSCLGRVTVVDAILLRTRQPKSPSAHDAKCKDMLLNQVLLRHTATLGTD